MSEPTNRDPVNHPKHYTDHPSGVECITITEHMDFNLGNAVKYVWRASLKNGIEDLKKARWYVDREIARLERQQAKAFDVAQQTVESVLSEPLPKSADPSAPIQAVTEFVDWVPGFPIPRNTDSVFLTRGRCRVHFAGAAPRILHGVEQFVPCNDAGAELLGWYKEDGTYMANDRPSTATGMHLAERID